MSLEIVVDFADTDGTQLIGYLDFVNYPSMIREDVEVTAVDEWGKSCKAVVEWVRSDGRVVMRIDPNSFRNG